MTDTHQLAHWKGSFGDAYVDRNPADEARLRASTAMWSRVLDVMAGDPPRSILEVGANVGANLAAMARLTGAELHALEPNDKARAELARRAVVPAARIHAGIGQAIPLDDGAVDMCFTCGVMIHVAPADLPAMMAEMYRVTRKYIVCIEYFADQPEEKSYRGHAGLLFKRDFGGEWLDRHPALVTMDYGFNWRRVTGLDNTTWWVFRKETA
jgi:pseudaminic acid biosynthesis-associated methylase